MILLRTLFFILLITQYLDAQIIVDETTEEFVLLNKTQVYLDKSNKEDINSLLSKPKLFKPYNKEYVNYGVYYNLYPVWIKFTLYNPTSKVIERTLSFDEYFLENIELYKVKNNKVLEKRVTGLQHREEFNGIIRSHFELEIPPNTKTTYYLKVFTPSYASFFKATISTYEKFIHEDIKYHLILALFLCILIMVFIYNMVLFFLTKDSLYLYYALYILGILAVKRVHFLLSLYIFPMENPAIVVQEISLIVYGTNFTALTMILFTQHFLHTKSYPKIHKSLNFFIALIIIHSIVTSPTFLTYNDIAFFYLFIILYLFFIGFYALYKKNENAKYFVFGWGLSVFAWISTILNSLSVWNNRYQFYYMTELSITLEVFIFSYVIAKYINKLNKDKEQLSIQLVEQKDSENIRLQKIVDEKTQELQNEVKYKENLLKELSHRVKNSLQVVSSFISMQTKHCNDQEVQSLLADSASRIQAMSNIHERLVTQDSINYVDMQSYFQTLLEENKLIHNFDTLKSIINTNKTTMLIDQATTVGLIINEAINNTFKHAFENIDNPTIKISLKKLDKNMLELVYQDNGCGYKHRAINRQTSLGQKIITSLSNQLRADMHTNKDNGFGYVFRFEKSI